MSYTVITTADGTLSCHDVETGELMHNRAGAYTEALKNYAEPCNALELVEGTGGIRLLDACYGLGYNTWVLADYLLKTTTRPFTMYVIAIEKSVDILQVSPQIFAHPYFDSLKSKIPTLEHNIYYRTFECLSDTKGDSKNEYHFSMDVVNGSRIDLTLFVDDLRHRLPKVSGSIDLVFHDAFSAQKMPELWTVDLFREYYRLLEPAQGSVLTYSAAAAVRGGLRETGFHIGKTMPLGAKHGGTKASLSPCGETLSDHEQTYLLTQAGIPYRDSGLNQARAEILRTRQLEQASSQRPSGTAIRKLLNTKE